MIGETISLYRIVEKLGDVRMDAKREWATPKPHLISNLLICADDSGHNSLLPQ
jgi:hypothetical protein